MSTDETKQTKKVTDIKKDAETKGSLKAQLKKSEVEKHQLMQQLHAQQSLVEQLKNVIVTKDLEALQKRQAAAKGAPSVP